MVDRPAVVMLHGWGSSAAVWRPVIQQLNGHYEYYVPDLPGHADSELTQTDLLSLCRQVLHDFHRPAIWLAWSLGALIAIKAALIASQQVQRLLIVSGTPGFVQTNDWLPAMPAGIFDQFLDEYRVDKARAQQRFIALQAHGDRHAREVREQLQAAATPANSDIYWGLELLRSQDLHGEMPALSCPVHCLYGANDSLIPVSLSGSMESIARVTVWAETGHVPFLSDLQGFMHWTREAMHG